MDEEEPQCDVPGIPREPIFKGDYSFNTGRIPNLDWLDYSILIVTICVTLGITVHVAWKYRKRASIDDYLLVGRDVHWFSAGASLVAGYLSGITVIGIPRLMYTDSSMEGWSIVAVIIGSTVSTPIFLPVFWNLRITSVYEYLGKRFNRRVRTIGSLYFIITTLIYLSMALYAPSISISAVTGIPLWTAIILVGCLCIMYTTLGGMRAVIYTDIFLFGVMALSVLCVLIKAVVVIGGFGEMWSAGRRSNRIIFNFSLDPKDDESFMAIVASGGIYALTSFGANQYNLHRLLCCRSDRDALKTIRYVLLPGVFWIMGGSILIGLTLGAFYENCDPIKTKMISDAKQILPFFVVDTMSDVIGLPGLFTAGVLSATLSTISSGLNSIATATLEDFIRVYIWQHVGEGRARLMTQVLTVLFGTVILEFSFFASKMKGALFQIDQSVNGALGAPLLAVFFLGVFFPWVNSKGALCSMLGGAAFNFFIIGLRSALTAEDSSTPATPCVSNCNLTVLTGDVRKYLENPTTPKNFERSDSSIMQAVSTRYYGCIGFLVTMAIGLLVSKCTGNRSPSDPTDPVLIVPVLDEKFPFYYLPESIRQRFRFGLDHTDKWAIWHAKQDELAKQNMQQVPIDGEVEEIIEQNETIAGQEVVTTPNDIVGENVTK